MLSVIVATHNGADTIDRTLRAMSELDTPAGGWKLIVVNNASSDETENLVLKWQALLPLEYVTEPRLGKSKAINTGLRHSEGDFVIMTDDDVLPERDWLVQWRRVADTLTGCSVFGGAIIPEFDAGPPNNGIPSYCYGVLYGASHPYAEGPIEVEPDTSLFSIAGANLAIRRTIYERGHKFDEAFLVGSGGLMGEDTEFVKRLSTLGYKVGFAPSARLHHIVHGWQSKASWIYNRFYRHGHTLFMLTDVKQDAQGRPIFKFPWRRLRTAIGSTIRLFPALLRGDKKQTFIQSHGLAYDLGALHQAIKLLRGTR